MWQYNQSRRLYSKLKIVFDKPLVEITGENNDEEEQLKQKKAENELSELE